MFALKTGTKRGHKCEKRLTSRGVISLLAAGMLAVLLAVVEMGCGVADGLFRFDLKYWWKSRDDK